MENHNPQINRDLQPDSLEFSEQSISLKPLVITIWSYRRVIAALVSCILIFFVVAALYIYISQPAEHQASLEFQLLFEGADQGKYPNGLPFSSAEIVGTSVLTSVYQANELKRYLSYDDFKNRLFVLDSNIDTDLLDLEYKAKLSDPRLTPVDRTALETEFRDKRAIFHKARYRLSFIGPIGTRQVPDVLASKLLNDILSTWAQQAADIKGVLTYQTKVYSTNVISKDRLEAEDYIVRLDVMRDAINRVIENVDELLKLPGATVMRVGKKRISLPDIRFELEDLRRSGVEPLTGMVRTAGITRDPSELTRYVESRLNQTKSDHEEAQSRVNAIRTALQSYMSDRMTNVQTGGSSRSAADATSPAVPGTSGFSLQLSESFLDRLVKLSSQNSDAAYRQRLTDQMIQAGLVASNTERELAYYEDLSNSIRRVTGSGRSVDRDTLSAIDKRFQDTYSSVVQALQEIDTIYRELSKQNLNPNTNLYAITDPFFSTTQRVITVRLIEMYAVLTLILSLVVVPLGCIVHYYLKREILAHSTKITTEKPIEEGRLEAKTRKMALTD